MTTPKSSQHEQAPVLLTVAEACAVLRISRWSFYQLVQRRHLETLKIGRRRFVTVEALDRLVGTMSAAEADK